MKTKHEYRGYVFTVTYEPKEPAYVVDFSDIPDIITSGQTLNEAFRNACDALDLHLESLHKLGKRLPKAKHRLTVEVDSRVRMNQVFGNDTMTIVDVAVGGSDEEQGFQTGRNRPVWKWWPQSRRARTGRFPGRMKQVKEGGP